MTAESFLYVTLSEGIRIIKEHLEEQEHKERTPDGLSPGTLTLFRCFKDAYDGRDINKLSQVISLSYSGSFYEASNKEELLNFFENVFDTLPAIMSPKLQITVHEILDQDTSLFQCMVDFKSRLTVLGVPVANFDSGLVLCKSEPEGKHGIWKLTSIETV